MRNPLHGPLPKACLFSFAGHPRLPDSKVCLLRNHYLICSGRTSGLSIHGPSLRRSISSPAEARSGYVMASRPEIYILDDVPQWAARAAALTQDLRRQAVEEHGRFLLVLSGGRTPELVYQRLTAVSSATRNEWASTEF